MQFKEISTPDTPPADEIRQYASDSSGISTMCWKNDAGSEFCLPTTGGTLVTGTGAAGRVTFWSGSSTLSSNANFTYDGSAAAGLGQLKVQAEGAANNARIEVVGHGASDPGFQGARSSGTIASPSATAIDSFLTFLGGAGWNNTPALVGNKALVGLKAEEGWTTTGQGTYITFETTPTGSTTRAEKMRLTGAGRLGIGTTAPAVALQVVQDQDGTGFGQPLVLDNYKSGSTPAPGIAGRGARGTLAAPSALAVDDIMATFGGRGYHSGGAFHTTNAGNIIVRVAEALTSTAQGSYITFNTTPLLSTTSAERFRVGPSGQWGIGGATFGTSGQFFTSGGASAAPTWNTHDSTGDPHTQYALLAGRSGGQTLIGGTGSGDDLVLKSSSNATPGNLQSITDGAINPTWLFDHYGDVVRLRTRRINGSVAAQTAILSGDVIGAYQFGGLQAAADFSAGAVQLQAVATENWSATAAGCKFRFTTTPNTTEVVTPAWDMDQNGDLVALVATQKIDLSTISAGNPNLKITATSDTPTVTWTALGTFPPSTAPAGYLEILVGANTRYIPFWA